MTGYLEQKNSSDLQEMAALSGQIWSNCNILLWSSA